MKAETLIEQALDLIQRNRLKQAERLLQHPGLASNPDRHFLLGLIHYRRNRFAESISLYEKALQSHPDEPEYLAHLGQAQFQAGHTGKGLKTLQQVSQNNPDHINSHLFLGQCLLKLHMPLEALGLFNQVLEKDRYHFQAWLGKVHALTQLGQLDKAGECLEDIGDFMQDRPELYLAYARLFMEQGKLDAAMEAAQVAQRLDPNNNESLRVMGQAMDQWGRRDEALKYYRKILKRTPYDLYVIYRMMRMGAEEIPALARRLRKVLEKNRNLPPQLRKTILYNLGSAEESMGNHEKAMELFLEAGKLHHQNPMHEETESYFHKLRQTFNREWFETAGAISRCPAQPIFIVGLPRSGSTLLESMLATVESVHVIGESPLLPQLSVYGGKLVQPEQSYPDWVRKLPKEQWTGLAEYYLLKAGWNRQESDTRIVDKNLGNLTHVGLIRTLFPHARVIHCRRNPLDVATSCLSIDFAGHFPWTYSMEDFIRYYRMYEELMAHWKMLLPEFMMEIQYEDMVENPERTSRELFEFLQLDWSEDVLAFSRKQRRVATASVNQVRKGIYTSSRQRWKRYGDLIRPLVEAFPEWATK